MITKQDFNEMLFSMYAESETEAVEAFSDAMEANEALIDSSEAMQQVLETKVSELRAASNTEELMIELKDFAALMIHIGYTAKEVEMLKGMETL